jgi:hypothetical protein
VVDLESARLDTLTRHVDRGLAGVDVDGFAVIRSQFMSEPSHLPTGGLSFQKRRHEHASKFDD